MDLTNRTYRLPFALMLSLSACAGERLDWTVDGEAFSVAMAYDEFGRVETIGYPEVPGLPRVTVERRCFPDHVVQTYANRPSLRLR